MHVEQKNKFVRVFFPESEETILAESINAQDIKNGETYLVDRDHNADMILKPVTEQPLPRGKWELEEQT